MYIESINNRPSPSGASEQNKKGENDIHEKFKR